MQAPPAIKRERGDGCGDGRSHRLGDGRGGMALEFTGNGVDDLVARSWRGVSAVAAAMPAARVAREPAAVGLKDEVVREREEAVGLRHHAPSSECAREKIRAGA